MLHTPYSLYSGVCVTSDHPSLFSIFLKLFDKGFPYMKTSQLETGSNIHLRDHIIPVKEVYHLGPPFKYQKFC